MIRSVSADAHTEAYRSRPASSSTRPSALATATWPDGGSGHFIGSECHRNSCSRSCVIAPSPSSPASQLKATLASPAATGSSRSSVASACVWVIMLASLPHTPRPTPVHVHFNPSHPPTPQPSTPFGPHPRPALASLPSPPMRPTFHHLSCFGHRVKSRHPSEFTCPARMVVATSRLSPAGCHNHPEG